MTEPRWVGMELVLAIHDEQLAAHGGMAGVRDEGLLASAIERPRNKWHYGEAALPALAAAYAFGIAKNHAVIDGNKRTAFMIAYTFLGLNDIGWRPRPIDVVIKTEALANGDIGEGEYANWIAGGLAP